MATQYGTNKRAHYMPRRLWQLIQTRRALGLKEATYSYLRIDPDTSLVALDAKDQPPKLNVTIQNSSYNERIIWEATWE